MFIFSSSLDVSAGVKGYGPLFPLLGSQGYRQTNSLREDLALALTKAGSSADEQCGATARRSKLMFGSGLVRLSCRAA